MAYSKTYQNRKNSGLCVSCGKENSLLNRLRCLACSEQASQRSKIYKANLRNNSLCSNCRKPHSYNKTRCADCSAIISRYHKDIRDKRANSSDCSECGKATPLTAFSIDSSYKPCETCYFKQVSVRRLGTNRFWKELKNKLKKQHYLCPYTGEKLVLGVNASLDHILPAHHYPELCQDIENVEWTTRAINEMKRDRTPEQFLSFIQHILNYRLGQMTEMSSSEKISHKDVTYQAAESVSLESPFITVSV